MQEPAIAQLVLIFIAGMAGSFHCVGMCGGFVCALGRDATGARAATAVRHLLYNTGRVVSYVFLGSLAGTLGASALDADGGGFAVAAQRALALVAGVLMIVMGLQLLGYLQRFHAAAAGFINHTLVASLRGVLHAPGRSAPLAFGVFNGFLPCPLVYAFLALAAATAHPAHGALVMAVFGLGTFPAMLASGGMGTWLRYRWRLRGVRLAGLFILMLGVLTLTRGVLPLDRHATHGLPWSATAIERTVVADMAKPADAGIEPPALANIEQPARATIERPAAASIEQPAPAHEGGHRH